MYFSPLTQVSSVVELIYLILFNLSVSDRIKILIRDC